MFDPFDDFETQGYLRNTHKLKDSYQIKKIEHSLFTVNIVPALEYLHSLEYISYTDFLKVHEILFKDIYPWAGQDRSITAPEKSIKKDNTRFTDAYHAELAVSEGLRMANNADTMRKKPGTIMGFFAFGHPFLDGNGRTMLVVHTELANRAGFSIDWQSTTKSDYLHHLSAEIDTPDKGILDKYLLSHVGPKIDLEKWSDEIVTLPGLNGLDEENAPDNAILGDVDDPKVIAEYEALQSKRNYEIVDIPKNPVSKM